MHYRIPGLHLQLDLPSYVYSDHAPGSISIIKDVATYQIDFSMYMCTAATCLSAFLAIMLEAHWCLLELLKI